MPAGTGAAVAAVSWPAGRRPAALPLPAVVIGDPATTIA